MLNQIALGTNEPRAHDLRRSAASNMTALGIQRLVVGKVLNHTDRSVTATYDRHEYLAEKRQALDVWGQRLHEIVTGQRVTTNVVALTLPR